MSAVLGSREAMQSPEEVFRTGQNHKREREACASLSLKEKWDILGDFVQREMEMGNPLMLANAALFVGVGEEGQSGVKRRERRLGGTVPRRLSDIIR